MKADLGPLDGFPEGSVVLRKDADGHRYACVRAGDGVHAVDDLCPHQGYPLSQGAVRRSKSRSSRRAFPSTTTRAP